jgi:hypothetical protein
MANIGQLFVELGINSAAFVEGMDKATYKAKQGAKEIADAFEDLGSSLGGILGKFGEFGEQIGGVFEGMGGVLGDLAGSMGSLGGAMGTLAVGTGAVVAAGVAVVGVLDGLALKSAESAANLYKMSEKTGVSVETLSQLGFVARETGVSQETLAKSLELMNKSAFAAATASDGATNAYTRLGVSVVDSNGHLKDTGALFQEVIGKLNDLQNAGERIALEKAIFGRGGSELAPMIAEAGEGFDKLTQRAKDLGMVVDGQTAKAAEEFEQDLEALGMGAEGVGNAMLSQLLPTFKVVAAQMMEGFKALLAVIKDWGPTIATVTKYFIEFGDLVWTIFKQGWEVEKLFVTELLVLVETLYKAAAAIAHLDAGQLKQAFTGGLDDGKAVLDQFLDNSKKDWKDYAKFVGDLHDAGPQKQGPLAPPNKGGNTDMTKAPDKAAIGLENQIKQYEALAAAKMKEAAADEDSIAALNMAKAAAAGDVEMSKLQAEVDKAQGAEKQKLTGILKQNEDAIRGAAFAKQFAEDATKANQGLQKETDAYEEQIKSLQGLAAAYEVGGQAIVDAQIEQKLSKDKSTVAELSKEYDILKTKPGVTADEMKEAAAALDIANQKLEKHREELHAINSEEIHTKVEEEKNALFDESMAYQMLAKAALESAAAQREAAAQVAAMKFKSQNPGASQSDVQAVHDMELQKQQEAHDKTIQQIAAQNDLNVSFEKEIDDLNEARALILKKGDDTLTIDAKIYDAQNAMNKQWDDAAEKIGDFQQRLAAVLDTLRQEGQNFWGGLTQDGLNALNSLESTIAKIAVTGKGSFKQVLQGFEESALQTGMKSLVSKGAGFILDNTGLGDLAQGKPDGSESNPFNVIMKNTEDMLNNLPDDTADNMDVGDMSGLGLSGVGGGGGVLGEVLKAALSFLPGMADGGDVTPGKAYVVGENHPEFFVPSTPGTIHPSLKMGGTTQNQVNVHFHGVQDADTFRRNQTQIGQHVALAVSMANGRR